MKKSILSLMAAVAFVAFADDTTYQALYWQINADDTSEFGDANYALLYADADGVKIVGDGQQLIGGAVGKTGTGLQGSGATFDWGAYDFTTAKFFVELFNESDEFLAQSDSVSYDFLSTSGHIAKQGAGSSLPTGATPYAFSGFVAVPEPTSGLLMLFGLAGLTLRRRRA